MSLEAWTICMNGGTWESRVFTQCDARTTQAYDKHTRTWGGFEINFPEYAKETSLINLRRDRKSKTTPLELSQLRAMNSQLINAQLHPLHTRYMTPLRRILGQHKPPEPGTHRMRDDEILQTLKVPPLEAQVAVDKVQLAAKSRLAGRIGASDGSWTTPLRFAKGTCAAF